MNLDTSAQAQNLQAAIKAADLDAMLHMEFTRKNKNWSDKPTSPHTTSFAEGLLKVEYERSKLKNVKRTGSKTFEVEMKECVNAINQDCPPFDVDDADEFKHVPIPLFHRTRVVTVDDKQTMFCSCSKFECRGYFCADQVCVAEAVYAAKGVLFPGFTHHDIACRYCTDYMYMAYKNTTPKHIQLSLHELMLNNVQGPTLCMDICDSFVIEEPTPKKNALNRLKNYDKRCINLDVVDGMYSSTYTPPHDGIDSEMELIFDQMFTEIQGHTSKDTEDAFELSLSNSCLPKTASHNVSSRQKLKCLVNTAFALSDKIGQEGVERLEETLLQFNQWCSSKIEEVENHESPQKRMYASMSQESYTSHVTRVFNTHHM